MASKLRSSSKFRQKLLSSRKDRWGILLLLIGAFGYWLLSRPDFEENSKWVFTEMPHSKKLPPPRNHKIKDLARDEGHTSGEGFQGAGPNHTWRSLKKRVDSTRPQRRGKQNLFSTSYQKAPLSISLNASDSMSWEQLPGIGPVLAARIIKYREKLGGFHSVSQLKEVYGITDSVYEKISPVIKTDQGTVKKIDLNNSSLEELKKHPYLRWQTASAIFRYREANGRFNSLEDLNKIWSLSPETILKIEPYLIIGNDSLMSR
jgi:competence ComEA-like helix-hairpin-helix protein